MLDRDWPSLDCTLGEVKTVSEKASQTEQIRAVVYQKIRNACGAGADESFQEILARVPAEDRENLSALHRRVRVAVEKVKCQTGGLDTYINSAVSTMDKILDELFPERKNRLYTRRGGAFTSSRPMMISRSL
jgi:hypothetical protein